MKLSRILKACVNPKILFSIGIIILLAYVFVPQISSYALILLLLACPVSMIIMMRSMDHEHNKTEKLFVCAECGLEYKDAEWAKKCAAWCKEHQSCNMDIIKHAVDTPMPDKT